MQLLCVCGLRAPLPASRGRQSAADMRSYALRRLTLWESQQRELSVLVSFCAALQSGSCPALEELNCTFDDDIRDEREQRRCTYEAPQWNSLRHLHSLRRFVWRTTVWTSELVSYHDLLAGLPGGLQQLELHIALYEHQAKEDVPGGMGHH